MSEKFIDLHIHSIFSDGVKTISELVEMAKNNNVKVFAIADHDDLRNFEILRPLAKQQGLAIISAIELSTYYINPSNNSLVKIHLLGYGIDVANSDLLRQMQIYRNKRYKANIEMLDKILKAGIEVPECIFNEVKFENYVSILTEIKRVLVKNNYDPQFVKSFITSINSYAPDYTGYEIDIFQAIELIQKSGGVAVLAHPQEIKMGYKDKDTLVKRLKKCGLIAIEVYHADATTSEMEENNRLASENDLLVSAGSDYHMPDENNKTIGFGINNNLLISKCSFVNYLEENNMLIK